MLRLNRLNRLLRLLPLLRLLRRLPSAAPQVRRTCHGREAKTCRLPRKVQLSSRSASESLALFATLKLLRIGLVASGRGGAAAPKDRGSANFRLGFRGFAQDFSRVCPFPHNAMHQSQGSKAPDNPTHKPIYCSEMSIETFKVTINGSRDHIIILFIFRD